jgi:hypothetical protein
MITSSFRAKLVPMSTLLPPPLQLISFECAGQFDWALFFSQGNLRWPATQ